MELKANELRIGNLLYLYNPESWEEFINEVVILEAIDLEISKKEKTIWKNSFGSLKLVSGKNQFNQFSEYAKPIPLTEEWLLKFGFQIDETYVSEQNPYLDYIKNEVRVSMPYYSFDFSDGAFNELKYVHQLQNLYFALTNKELEIKM